MDCFLLPLSIRMQEDIDRMNSCILLCESFNLVISYGFYENGSHSILLIDHTVLFTYIN